jgi:hemerythrin
MALFTWRSAYATGVRAIDADHMRLFALADGLHAALAQNSDKSDLRDRLAALIDHTRAHFAREERIMLGCDYPGIAAHRAEHEDLTGTALRIQRHFLMDRSRLRAETLRSLKEWLARHIETSDRLLGEHLLSTQGADGAKSCADQATPVSGGESGGCSECPTCSQME